MASSSELEHTASVLKHGFKKSLRMARDSGLIPWGVSKAAVTSSLQRIPSIQQSAPER